MTIVYERFSSFIESTLHPISICDLTKECPSHLITSPMYGVAPHAHQFKNTNQPQNEKMSFFITN